MAYQVLALKWRPRKFEEVVGQEHVTRTLQNAIARDRVPHAFLLTGSRGVGKTTTARILAKALVCEHGPTEHPCDTCRFCVEIREGRSLDVLEIDGASNRGIDEIRDLRENARYAPSAARMKIYIIDEVHMLTKEAFNALLKTLEEPPPHVKFIFATTEIVKVPITIQSRCQRYDFRLLSREQISGQLRKIVAEEDVEISEGALAAIAAAAEGSLRDSQSLLDQVLAYSGRKVGEQDVTEALGIAEEKTVVEFLAALVKRDAAVALGSLDRLAATGYDLRAFIREVLTGLRHLAVLKASPDLEGLVSFSADGLASARKIAAETGIGRVQSLFDIFLKAENEIRGASFPRMVLELAVLRAVRLEEVESLRELVDRLERLENNLPPPSEPASRETGRGRLADSRGKDREPSPTGEAPPYPAADESLPDEEAYEAVPGDPPPTGLEGTFDQIVAKVRKESVVIASFLEHGKLSSIGTGEIVVAFEAGDTLFYDTFKEAENISLLRRAAAAVLEKKMDVRLVSLDDGEQGGKKSKESDLKKKYRREALEHPLVQDVIEVFQAQVMDVKIL